MSLVSALTAFLAGLYAVWMMAAARGFRRVVQSLEAHRSERPFFSVIIPARNEEAHIVGCLESVLNSSYPPDRFEVIVVDDASTDATAALIKNFRRETGTGNEKITLITLKHDPERRRAHKKQALETGISRAIGEWIICTDGDSVVPYTWLESTAAAIRQNVAVVSGPVMYHRSPSRWTRLLELELVGLVTIGAGWIGFGRPGMANGANLAYRKDTFVKIGGFSGIDSVSSGDDELLVQKIRQETDQQIVFNPDHQSVVMTQPSGRLSDWIQQRKRWASKGRIYRDRRVKAFAATVFLLNTSIVAGLIGATITGIFPPTLIVAFVVKFLVDLILMVSGCVHFKRADLLIWFPLAQILQPFYVAIIGFLSLSGGFTWKDRKLDS